MQYRKVPVFILLLYHLMWSICCKNNLHEHVFPSFTEADYHWCGRVSECSPQILCYKFLLVFSVIPGNLAPDNSSPLESPQVSRSQAAACLPLFALGSGFHASRPFQSSLCRSLFPRGCHMQSRSAVLPHLPDGAVFLLSCAPNSTSWLIYLHFWAHVTCRFFSVAELKGLNGLLYVLVKL